jgi:hypothetical protein
VSGPAGDWYAGALLQAGIGVKTTTP